MGRTDFSVQFRKIMIHHKRIGYNLNVMRQSACLVTNPITVDNFLGTGSLSSVAWSTGAQLMIFFFLRFQWGCLAFQGSPTVTHHVSVESSSLPLHSIKT